MDEMFYGFDFSEISDDSPLFKWISSLDVSNVKDMGYMFQLSSKLQTITFPRNLNTSQATFMSGIHQML